MRILPHAGAALLGAAVALASVAVHRTAVLHLPLGLLLAIATTFLVAWTLRPSATRSRLASSYSLGWLVLFGVVVLGRPEGDYALAGDLDGYALMGAGFLLVVVAVTSLAGRGAGTAGASPNIAG